MEAFNGDILKRYIMPGKMHPVSVDAVNVSCAGV